MLDSLTGGRVLMAFLRGVPIVVLTDCRQHFSDYFLWLFYR